jgi:hypothetical protein
VSQAIDETLAILAKQRGLNYAPGNDYLYSNSNYFLMSLVGERFRERLRISSCCLTSTDSATTERAPPGPASGRLSPAGG